MRVPLTLSACDIPLWFQIPNILMQHETFLEDLKRRLDSWEQKTTIGDWFLECVSFAACSFKISLTMGTQDYHRDWFLECVSFPACSFKISLTVVLWERKTTIVDWFLECVSFPACSFKISLTVVLWERKTTIGDWFLECVSFPVCSFKISPTGVPGGRRPPSGTGS